MELYFLHYVFLLQVWIFTFGFLSSLPLWVYIDIFFYHYIYSKSLCNNFACSIFCWWIISKNSMSKLVMVVGTKLQHVVSSLALEIVEQTGPTVGTQVKPRDDLFWFGKPVILLRLIQFIIFQVTCISYLVSYPLIYHS